MKTKKYKKGFSLIESIIYLALFGLIISSALFSSYGIIESGNKNSEYAKYQNEALFINQKINWALSDVENILVSNNGKILTITKHGPVTENPLVFSHTNNHIDFTVGTQPPLILTNESFKITDLLFIYDSLEKYVSIEYKINDKEFKYRKYLDI